MTSAARRTTLAAVLSPPPPCLPRADRARTPQSHARAGDRHRQGADPGERRRLGRHAARRGAAGGDERSTPRRSATPARGASSDLTRFDPSVTTAYDTEGYVDYFTIRGFVVDNRFNFRRDGLPINAETSIPLENKARVDILKGLAGLQAGTSAPGGLVDLVVKRPLDAPLRSAFVEWRERGSVLGSVDISQRFGADDAFGVRLNAGAEHIDPIVRNARGNRNVLALAGDWRVGRGDADRGRGRDTAIGRSRACPASACSATACRRCPTRSSTSTTSRGRCRWCSTRRPRRCALTQKLGAGWRLVVHGLAQRLRTDDRIAFPFGCSDPIRRRRHLLPDRFCPNGTFDLYDFRSDDESRRSSTLDVTLHGAAATGALDARAQRRHAANDRQEPLPGRRLQLRRHRQRRRHAASRRRRPMPCCRRPTATSARASSRCATPSPSARPARPPGSARATRASRAARRRPTARRAHRLPAIVHHAFRGAEPGARPRPARLRELGQGRRERRGAERAARPRPRRRASLSQRRSGVACGREPADRDRRQGRRRAHRMERGGIRHPPPALRRHRHRRSVRRRAVHARPRRQPAPPGRRGQPGVARRRLGRARRRAVAARTRRDTERPDAGRQAADQRARPHGAPAGRLAGAGLAPRAAACACSPPAPTRARARCCPTTASRSRA